MVHRLARTVVACQLRPMDDDRVGRRIFQTWKSKSELPKDFADWRSTLIGLNPSFEFTLWDDADNRAFMAQNFPWFLPVYDAFPTEIYRVDCVRYFYLYAHGGLYVDLDTECLAPLDWIADSTGVILGRMGTNPNFMHSIPNAIMASRPREEFWLLVVGLIWVMSRILGGDRPEHVTGPAVLKSAVDIYGARESLLTSVFIGSYSRRLPDHLKPREGRTKIQLLAPGRWYGLDWSNPEHQSIRREIRAGRMLSEYEKARLFPDAELVIPTCVADHAWAQLRRPMDMTRHGWSRSLFQASQQRATIWS
jgi:hypothetical protein